MPVYTKALAVGIPVTAVVGLIAHSRQLEQLYPLEFPSKDDILLRPRTSTQYTSLQDSPVFSARVPKSCLLKQKQQEYWAKTFLTSPSITLEARLIGLLTRLSLTPGDQGLSGYHRGQSLLNGAFTVKDSSPLVVEWAIPEIFVEIAETLASYGLPYRCISSGRHSFEVVEAGTGYRLIFGTGHDYERMNRSTGQKDGKEIPIVFRKLQYFYARRLLHEAVMKCESQTNQTS